ncbi:MAG: OadG family protein [Kineothrix sp.]
MKKWLLVLGMITCMFGMSACGGEKKAGDGEPASVITEEEAMAYAEQIVTSIAMICADDAYAEFKEQLAQDPVVGAAVSSWEGAMGDMGDYIGVLDKTAEAGEEGVDVVVTVEGSERNAKVEIVLDETGREKSITTSVIYPFGELMEKAALNTLLGMGTVFLVLVLISLIIYCFGLIPRIQAAFSRKPKEEPAVVDNTITQIIEQEEQSRQEDDLELAAVIAAAIAASEGAASTDGFVVRSIRKRRTF